MICVRYRFLLVVLVLLAYLPSATRYWQDKQTLAQRTFVLPAAGRVVDAPPHFTTELIPPDPLVPSAHVSSVCETPDGKLRVAWYGGTHEGARDVNIYWSTRAPGEDQAWSMPQVLVSRASALQELRRPVKKVGNAMMFADSAGQLRLIYVTVSIGGWSTSSLNVKTSRDGGQTWLPSQRLTLSPFFNLSELVKNLGVAST